MTNQQNIALFHPWIHSRGGVEKIILKLLQKSQHNIKLYTAVYKPDQTFEEFQNHEVREITKLPIKGYLLRGISFTLALLTKKIPEQHDKIVISTAGIAEFLNFRNHNRPIIGYCHTPLKAAHDPHTIQQNKERMNLFSRKLYQTAIKTYQIIEKHAWKHFDHVQFNSKNTQQRALQSKLIDKEKTSINYPGAQVDNQPSKTYEKYFLYPSRFVPYKRQEKAIEAYHKFRENNPDTDFKLILAGATQDEEEKQQYFAKIQEKAQKVEGVEIRTNVPGDEWENLYKNCYTVIFPSINEDWGIVPIEAMSHGKPVIALKRGGPTESIQNQETGILIEQDDMNQMAQEMEKLAKDEELVREMGKKAHQRSQKYTWEKFVEQFDQCVKETEKT